MKLPLPSLILALLPAMSLAAPAPGAATFLSCIGAQPWWEQSWATPAKGVENNRTNLIIKLSADKTTATVKLASLGEQVFNIQASDELYQGGISIGRPALDGVISSASISINRINGGTHIGFKVANSTSDGSRWAFSGRCEPASAKF